MNYLLKSLVQIAMFQKDPSILPASIVLLVLTAVAYGALNMLYAWISIGPDRIMARGAADLALVLLLFWALLALSGRRERFRQTTSAVLGTYVVISPFVTALLLLRFPAQTSPAIALLMMMGSAIVVSWYALIVGHILRSAIQVGFVTSIAIAISWLFGGDVLLNRVFAATA